MYEKLWNFGIYEVPVPNFTKNATLPEPGILITDVDLKII